MHELQLAQQLRLCVQMLRIFGEPPTIHPSKYIVSTCFNAISKEITWNNPCRLFLYTIYGARSQQYRSCQTSFFTSLRPGPRFAGCHHWFLQTGSSIHLRRLNSTRLCPKATMAQESWSACVCVCVHFQHHERPHVSVLDQDLFICDWTCTLWCPRIYWTFLWSSCPLTVGGHSHLSCCNDATASCDRLAKDQASSPCCSKWYHLGHLKSASYTCKTIWGCRLCSSHVISIDHLNLLCQPVDYCTCWIIFSDCRRHHHCCLTAPFECQILSRIDLQNASELKRVTYTSRRNYDHGFLLSSSGIVLLDHGLPSEARSA